MHISIFHKNFEIQEMSFDVFKSLLFVKNRLGQGVLSSAMNPSSYLSIISPKYRS